MKKYILLLVLAICSLCTISAQSIDTPSLKDAFNQLSHIPNVNVKTQMDSLDIVASKIPAKSVIMNDVSIATAYDLDRVKVKQVGDDMFSVLNNIGLQYVINGATNNLVAGFIYAKPIGNNLNEILLVACAGEEGFFAAIYGTIDDYTVTSLQTAPLQMVGPKMAIEPADNIFVINLGY